MDHHPEARTEPRAEVKAGSVNAVRLVRWNGRRRWRRLMVDRHVVLLEHGMDRTDRCCSRCPARQGPRELRGLPGLVVLRREEGRLWPCRKTSPQAGLWVVLGVATVELLTNVCQAVFTGHIRAEFG